MGTIYQTTQAIIKGQLKIFEAELSSITIINPIEQKALALVKRIRKHPKSFLFFAKDSGLPFTNNQAERDIRMVKLKIKISGAFRTVEGIRIFARLRGFISTCKKQNINVFQAIRNIIKG